MSHVMMIDIPDACHENINARISQVLTAIRRQMALREADDVVMGRAVVVNHRLTGSVLGRRDTGDTNLTPDLRIFEIRYMGGLFDVPFFVTGAGITKTNGVLGWPTNRVPTVMGALAIFYQPYQGNRLNIQMGSYRDPTDEIPGIVSASRKPRCYTDLEDVKREIHL